jgi:hypothetical protein
MQGVSKLKLVKEIDLAATIFRFAIAIAATTTAAAAAANFTT